MFLVGRKIGVEGPLTDVAVHVVEAPGVGLLGADFLVGEVGVVSMPGVFVDLGGVISEGIGGLGAGPAGVFPLCFGGETVVVAGVSREPLAEF